MRRKSKKQCNKKKGVQSSKAKKSKIALEEEDVPKPMEINLSELSLGTPSTSQDISQNNVALLDPDKLEGISKKVNLILDKCFVDKSEIIINRQIFEEVVSETLLKFYSQEDLSKSTPEIKHLTDECKILQSEQIKLNRQRYALEKQVEDAKHIVKKLIDEKCLHSRGIVRKAPPAGMIRQVRSVGLQVSLVGPMFVSKQAINYSSSIINQYKESILPDIEGPQPHTARKQTFHHEVKMDNESNFHLPSSSNCHTPQIKDNSSEFMITSQSKASIHLTNDSSTGRKSIAAHRRMPQESAISRPMPKCENASSSQTDNPSKRMSTRKTKAEETKPVEVLKVKSLKVLNHESNLRKTENQSLGYTPRVPMIRDVLFIKEEVIDDIVEISEDEDVEEVISEVKGQGMAFDTKEAGTQVNANISVSKNCYVKSNELPLKVGVGAEPLIKVRSPEFINAHLLKSFNSTVSNNSPTPSTSATPSAGSATPSAGSATPSAGSATPSAGSATPSAGSAAPSAGSATPSAGSATPSAGSATPSTSSVKDNEKVAFCKFPKYPMSPKYPPNVKKPPAPILQIGKKTDINSQGIMLTWSFATKKPQNIVEYQLYTYQENGSYDFWKKVGDIKALPLPMACCLSQFVEGETYHFIIRAVDSYNRLGDFSIPAGIKLQKLDPTQKFPVGTLFQIPPPKN